MTEADIEKMFEPYGNIVQCRLLKTQPQGTSKGVAFILFELHEQAEEAMLRLHNKVLPNSTAPLDIKFATDNQKSGGRQGAPQQGGGVYNPKQNFAYGQAYGMPAYYEDPTGAFGGPMKHRQQHRFNPLNSAAGHGMDIFQAGGYNAYSAPYGNPPGIPIRQPPRTPMDGNGMSNRPQAAGHTLFVYNIGLTTEEPELRNLFANYGVISKINVIKKSNGYAFVTFDDRQQAEEAIKSLHGQPFAGNLLQVSFKK